MIQYWPYEQSEDLNNEVAILFKITKQKIYTNLYNNTSQYLYIDILDNHKKYIFFSKTLEELENLILDLLAFDIKYQEIKKLNHQLLCNLINKTTFKIINNQEYYNHHLFNITEHKTINEHKLLMEYLLIYLVFGSSHIDPYLFAFDNKYTPKIHINILLENFIIQVSNIIMKYLFSRIKSTSKLILFLNKYELCNCNYISIRSLTYLKNNIKWQKMINQYINQPKSFYNSRYPVFLLSSNGIVNKYIYLSHVFGMQQLNKKQSIFLLFIEIQDLCIPKIEKIITILCKIILYLLINIIINITIFIIKVVLNHFQDNNK